MNLHTILNEALNFSKSTWIAYAPAIIFIIVIIIGGIIGFFRGFYATLFFLALNITGVILSLVFSPMIVDLVISTRGTGTINEIIKELLHNNKRALNSLLTIGFIIIVNGIGNIFYFAFFRRFLRARFIHNRDVNDKSLKKSTIIHRVSGLGTGLVVSAVPALFYGNAATVFNAGVDKQFNKFTETGMNILSFGTKRFGSGSKAIKPIVATGQIYQEYQTIKSLNWIWEAAFNGKVTSVDNIQAEKVKINFIIDNTNFIINPANQEYNYGKTFVKYLTNYIEYNLNYKPPVKFDDAFFTTIEIADNLNLNFIKLVKDNIDKHNMHMRKLPKFIYDIIFKELKSQINVVSYSQSKAINIFDKYLIQIINYIFLE